MALAVCHTDCPRLYLGIVSLQVMSSWSRGFIGSILCCIPRDLGCGWHIVGPLELFLTVSHTARWD